MADGDLIFIEEQDGEGGRLGRNVVHHDPRNRDYPVRGILFDTQEDSVIRRVWWARHLFDQGNTSSCTAQAASGLLHTSPFRINLARTNLTAYDSHDERYALYREAQKHDPWEGEYEGSSTDAPFIVLRNKGQIAQWRWCFGLQDVLLTLSWHGPVAIGINWYEGFDRPRSGDGLVEATGAVRGGHAFELYSVNPDPDYAGGGHVDCLNSWGAYGPRGGRFRMSWATLERVLHEQGEACTVVL